MIRIGHIINPVKVKKSSDLYTAQAITFESMRHARNNIPDGIEVELYSIQYPEDYSIIPEYFKKLPDLERSVLNIASFEQQRKLPLIFDIVKALYENSSADYLIYTNADIGLMPDFYKRVTTLINEGHDAIIINRRRIPGSYHSVDQLPEIYMDRGKSHPGFDCFIFHRHLYPKFRFGNICVGIPFIGVNFAHNLFAFSKNLKFVDDEHLTFHIGMEVIGNWEKDYYWHNRNEFNRIAKDHLWDHFDIRKFPYGQRLLPVRLWKWGVNPSLFIFMNLKLEWKRLMLKFRLRRKRPSS